MNAQQRNIGKQATPARRGAPTWWIVAGRELTELWFGKGPIILLLYSIVLGLVCFVFATNVELGLFPAKDAMWMLLQVVYNAAAIIAIGLGADSFSGERDRETLEGLLLTPASRVQIAVGKFLAAFSAWLACAIISVPYFAQLAPDHEILGRTLLWGGICSSALAAGMVGLGMIVSAFSTSNKVSMFASLALYLVFLGPSQFIGMSQQGDAANWIQWVNPLQVADDFTRALLVNGQALEEVRDSLIPILGFPALVLALLFLVVGPRLRLDARLAFRWRRRHAVATAAGLALLCIAGSSGAAPAPAPAAHPPLEIAIDREYKQAMAGEKIEFDVPPERRGRASSPTGCPGVGLGGVPVLEGGAVPIQRLFPWEEVP